MSILTKKCLSRHRVAGIYGNNTILWYTHTDMRHSIQKIIVGHVSGGVASSRLKPRRCWLDFDGTHGPLHVKTQTEKKKIFFQKNSCAHLLQCASWTVPAFVGLKKWIYCILKWYRPSCQWSTKTCPNGILKKVTFDVKQHTSRPIGTCWTAKSQRL